MTEEVHDDSHEAYLETALVDALTNQGHTLSYLCGDADAPLRDSEGEKVDFDTVTTLFDAGLPAAQRGAMVTLTDGTQFTITVSRYRKRGFTVGQGKAPAAIDWPDPDARPHY